MKRCPACSKRISLLMRIVGFVLIGEGLPREGKWIWCSPSCYFKGRKEIDVTETVKELLILKYPKLMSPEAHDGLRRGVKNAVVGTKFEGASIVVLEGGLTISTLSCESEELPDAVTLLNEGGHPEIANLVESFVEEK